MRYRLTAVVLGVGTLLIALLASPALAQGQEGAVTFEVTVENVSMPRLLDTDRAMGAVPMSPGVYAVYDGDENPVFTAGEAASQGVELIAEDGFPMMLADAIAENANVTDSGMFQASSGELAPAFAPGTSGTFTMTAKPGQYFSFMNMFVQSNDYFFADDGSGISLFDGNTPISGDLTSQIELWDAGSEEDTEPGTGEFQKPVQDMDATNIGPSEGGVITLVSEADDGFTVPANSAVIKMTINPMQMPSGGVATGAGGTAGSGQSGIAAMLWLAAATAGLAATGGLVLRRRSTVSD